MSSRYRDLFVSASDGLRLYARDYGPDAQRRPAGRLPAGPCPDVRGFSRARRALSTRRRPTRAGFCRLDYRGRGRSEWDKDWRNYDVRVELDDTLQVLTAAGIEQGRLRRHLARRPDHHGPERGPSGVSLRGAVLNDVGPVIEAKGLVRIKGYVGKLPSPRDFAGRRRDPEADLRMRNFPAYTDEQWEAMARGTWREAKNGACPQLRSEPDEDAGSDRSRDAPAGSLAAVRGTEALSGPGIRGSEFRPAVGRDAPGDAAAHPRLKAVTVPVRATRRPSTATSTETIRAVRRRGRGPV